MIKSFKFKLRPNKTQENIFYEWLDTCRLIYNLTIEQKKYAWDTHQVSISKYESYIPKDFEEQKKIGDYFQKLDNQIELQQKELEKLKNIKKASLAKMFV